MSALLSFLRLRVGGRKSDELDQLTNGERVDRSPRIQRTAQNVHILHQRKHEHHPTRTPRERRAHLLKPPGAIPQRPELARKVDDEARDDDVCRALRGGDTLPAIKQPVSGRREGEGRGRGNATYAVEDEGDGDFAPELAAVALVH